MTSTCHPDRKNQERLLGLALIVATISAYSFLLFCDFIRFDDPSYVIGNPHVRSGFATANIVWAFSSFHSSNWHPLTWLSHMLDCNLYGLDPTGHHLTNLLFHVGNTLLLFLFLRKATDALWQSFAVAALFALHPLHVESVAWISERKDVLCTFFWMLALVAYVDYIRQPRVLRYLWVLLFFALGLTAKPMIVTFPFLLLLMDYWPLKRTGPLPHLTVWRHLLLEKVPFFLLSAGSCVVTLFAQADGRAIRSLEVIPLGLRVENAIFSYLRYLFYTLWPHDLTIFYPHPASSQGPLLLLGAALLLVAVSALAILLASRRPYLLVGWLWYLGTLVPVIGLLQVGDQAMADRYTYIPLVGIFIAFVWGLSDFLAAFGVRRIITGLLFCTISLALIMATRTQVLYWQDDETLFQRALEVNPDNYVAHLLLAQVANMEGNSEKASFHKRRAIEINPAFVAKSHNRWGYYLAREGQLDEAIADFEEAIRIRPDYANARYNLGVLLARQAQFDEAMNQFNEALRISPGNPNVLEALRIMETEKVRARKTTNN